MLCDSVLVNAASWGKISETPSFKQDCNISQMINAMALFFFNLRTDTTKLVLLLSYENIPLSDVPSTIAKHSMSLSPFFLPILILLTISVLNPPICPIVALGYENLIHCGLNYFSFNQLIFLALWSAKFALHFSRLCSVNSQPIWLKISSPEFELVTNLLSWPCTYCTVSSAYDLNQGTLYCVSPIV